MKIGLIGLGKMGYPLLQNMRENNIEVVAHDINPEIRASVEECGGEFCQSVQTIVDALGQEQKVIWLMLPAGAPTENVFQEVLPLLREGDILIEGGNTHFEDSKRRHQEAATRGVSFFDVGTSGGVSGARNGACMMIGGDAERFKEIEFLFEAINVENGYFYAGESGSGHYLKMVHNGIEYGMMQAIGEGFNLLHHSEYPYDLAKVAKVWNHGSVIRSWLMELTESLLLKDANMTDLEGAIPSSGEGRWTVEEALKHQVSLPVITQALMVRFASTDQEKYGEKVVASLRNEFGGHAIPVREDD
ncbi:MULTISPECIES: phosphogluconate dehydrogenase (NAD(+)-dependent, decarboxylating) [unclassified Jeotgalibaca]|uniref:phosphogluconate dehydrogenase (NAD(+)-dependent, decarboxylating) n=1 Tax=unclassified Jeotgalibaca TaxID=2621505 RepID=UPI003FCF74BC